MPTVLLVRHARSSANAAAVLSGRTPGVRLDETGVAQAAELGARLAEVPLALIVTSPLERCVDTASALQAGREGTELTLDARLIECDYGAWTGRALKTLAKEPAWKAVQAHPSSVRFPDGETMRGMQARGVDAVREHDAAVAASHGPDAVWVAVSHGDVIKSVLADALGCHLDEFQRIVVDPASVSIVWFTELRPFVVRMNDTGGSFAELLPARRRRSRRPGRRDSEAVLGGTTGSPLS